MEKVKIEYRAERRNKKSKYDRTSKHLNYVSEFAPYTKEFNIGLARHMLNYCRDFTHIKRITGLSILRMVKLNLIEWYHPYSKVVYKDSTDIKGTTVPDINITWLRRKA